MAITANPLLLCDGAWENPRNRKVHLDGIFTSLKSTKFPTSERFLVVYAQLIGDPNEEGTIQLECIEELTGLPLARSGGKTALGVHGVRHLQFSFSKIKFPEPGRYYFQLTCDGRLIGEATLNIRKVENTP